MALLSPVVGLRSPLSTRRSATFIQLNPLFEITSTFSDLAGANSASFGESVARVEGSVVLLNANATSRPVWAREPLTGKRNRLLQSNTFSEADWLRTNSNVTAVADGWKLQDSEAGGSNAVIIRQIYTALTGTNSFSIEAKQDQLDQIAIRAFEFDTDSTSYFSLSAGTVLTQGPSHTASIEALEDDWYRVSIEFTTSLDVSGLLYVYAASNLSPVVDLDGTSSILIRRAQGEGGTLTTYQETTNEYDTTESGIRSLNYLSFDGVDDELSNASFDTSSNSWALVLGVNSISSFQTSFSNANISLSSNTFSVTVNNTSSNTQTYTKVVVVSQRDDKTLTLADRDFYASTTTGSYANASAEFKISGGGQLYSLQAYDFDLNGAALDSARDSAIFASGEL
jgi:hypothetical protein